MVYLRHWNCMYLFPLSILIKQSENLKNVGLGNMNWVKCNIVFKCSLLRPNRKCLQSGAVQNWIFVLCLGILCDWIQLLWWWYVVVFVYRNVCFVGISVVHVFSATMQDVKTCTIPCVHCCLVHGSTFLLGVMTPSTWVFLVKVMHTNMTR
jgi:hypothetical protein